MCRYFFLCLPLLLIQAVYADTPQEVPQQKPEVLEELLIVVSKARPESPLTVTTDPKKPRQPLPAHDGADYLKTIPGFSVIRKGGSDGDPVFRGMAGSRLNMLLDGETLLGGCGGRMDPPTAYVFPETYDRIRLIKGPQTVLYGPGNSAGTVLFERNHDPLPTEMTVVHGSALVGSFGRNDEMMDVISGTPEYYLRGTASNARQGDYRDGDGNAVHSNYHRWSANTAIGWTPDEDTVLELSAARSDGEAAYADRGVDGSRFARKNTGLRFIKDNISDIWKKLDTQVYYNYIDHVMDNYSLRTPSGMMATPAAMNPDRETIGGRMEATLLPADDTDLVVGVDAQTNHHANRMSMNEWVTHFEDLRRDEDANFHQQGVFAELTQHLTKRDRMVLGARADRWQVEDERDVIALNMMMTATNPTANADRKKILESGFMRYERDLEQVPASFYAGLGHSERFPDYWELFNKETFQSISAFAADPEKTTQLDTGLVYEKDNVYASVSAFTNQIEDYLLIQSQVAKPAGMGSRMTTVTRNINAHTWGAEATAAYTFAGHWTADTSLAWVRGENDTDDTALAQMSPLETRFGLSYRKDNWSLGGLWRLVAEQNHVDINKGNIVGQDLGTSDGFGVFSLNAGWQPVSDIQLTAGIDNIFDKTYAEHISRNGEMISGFAQTTRVNEPGRTVWMKAQLTF